MHWLACIWLLMPQLQSTFRENADVQNALNYKMFTLNQTSCEACTCASDQDSPVCLSPCLTACEILTVSEELGIPAHTVRNGQQWMCRAVDKVSARNQPHIHIHIPCTRPQSRACPRNTCPRSHA